MATIVDELEPSWNETVLLIVSDHDQEMVTVDEPFDLGAAAKRAGVRARFAYDGSAAAIVSDDPRLDAWLTDEEEVACVRAPLPQDRCRVRPTGGWFGKPGWGGLLRGVHGGEHHRAGGHRHRRHAVVAELAASLHDRRPEAADWAPTCLALLGLPMPSASGLSLA